jgi:hypothetical protein
MRDFAFTSSRLREVGRQRMGILQRAETGWA